MKSVTCHALPSKYGVHIPSEMRSTRPGLRTIVLVWKVQLAEAVEENFKQARRDQIFTLKMRRGWDVAQL